MKRYSAMTAMCLGVCILVTHLSRASEDVGSIDELLQQAESAIKKAAKPEERIFSRTKLALAFHRAGKKEAAATAIAKNLTESQTLLEDQTLKENFIGSIAIAQAQMGDWDSVFRTMGMIKNNRGNPAWVFLFDLALEAGETPHAFDIATRFEKGFGQDGAISQIADTLAQQGKLDDALQLLDKIQNADLKTGGLVTVCQVLWESQKFDDIDRIEKLIEKPSPRANVLYRTILAELAAGDRVRADRTLERFTEVAKLLDEKDQITTFARIQAHQGELAKAIATAETIQDANSRQNLLAEIATVFAKSGHSREALQLLRSIEKMPLLEKSVQLDEVRRETAVALMKDRSLSDAAETAEAIADQYIRSKAWRQIAASQSKADPKGAASSLAKALLAARKLPMGSGTDVIALQEVGETQAETGDADAAGHTFHLALQAALRYEDQGYQGSLAFDVARAFAKSLGSTEIREWALMQSSPTVAWAALIGAAEGRLDSQ